MCFGVVLIVHDRLFPSFISFFFLLPKRMTMTLSRSSFLAWESPTTLPCMLSPPPFGRVSLLITPKPEQSFFFSVPDNPSPSLPVTVFLTLIHFPFSLPPPPPPPQVPPSLLPSLPPTRHDISKLHAGVRNLTNELPIFRPGAPFNLPAMFTKRVCWF